MKRLTVKSAVFKSGVYENMAGMVCGVELKDVFDRLAAIEDILGDDYDLERLRELVEADRDGRCVIYQSGYPIVSHYYRDDDGLYVREVSGIVSQEEYESKSKGQSNG